MSKKGRWVKVRRTINDYPETEQQKKIREAGILIKENCTGKKGQEFQTCRIEVLDKVFKGSAKNG